MCKTSNPTLLELATYTTISDCHPKDRLWQRAAGSDPVVGGGRSGGGVSLKRGVTTIIRILDFIEV